MNLYAKNIKNHSPKEKHWQFCDQRDSLIKMKMNEPPPMRHMLSLLSLLFVCAACSVSHFTPRSEAIPYHAPTLVAEVELLQELPKRAFIELGTVHVQGTYFNYNESMVNRLKTEAAAHGADAIIIYQGINTDKLLSGKWNNNQPRTTMGIAIRYKDAP